MQPALVDPSPPLDRAAAVQQLLDDLVAAAARGDRAAFDRHLATDDPALAARGDVWYANLRTFGGRLRLEATTAEAVPGIRPRARQGDSAWLQRITTSWRPPGSRQTARATLWLTLTAEEGRAILAGDADAPAADRTAPRPLWLQSSVAVRQRGDVTVVGVAGQPLDSWLDRAGAAAGAVRQRLPRWSGALTLEAPATQASFERSIGVATGSYARIGAVAWPRGDHADALVDVVVNPAVTQQLRTEAVNVLLTHEIVHVATRSFASAAPTWLTEGYADQIAYATHPATRRAALRPLEVGPQPTRLPGEADFDAGARDLDLAYAQAWSLCSLIADRHGTRALDRLYAEVSRGVPLADGLATLGTTEPALLRDWRAELARLR